MKTFLILTTLFSSISYNSYSQSCENIPLPYYEGFESTESPWLPDCTWSAYSFFSSSEIFETSQATVEGYNGKVIQYDTASASTNGQTGSVRCNYNAGDFNLTEGQNYTFSIRFGKSLPQATANITIYITTPAGGGDYITLANQDIPGTIVNFSQTFSAYISGPHKILIIVTSVTNSGYVYLDDITMQAAATADSKENTLSGLSIYPNPVKDVLNLNYKDAIDTVKIYSNTGQLLVSENPNAAQASVNLDKLATGVYFVTIFSGGLTKQFKILKE